MTSNIQNIHENIYNYLINLHAEDESFLFTLRQQNRSNRLSKGYWFLGDDNYLAVSFWRGKDWTTKMPRIAFVIYSNGETRVEFSAKDVEGSFFSKDAIRALSLNIGNYSGTYFKTYARFGNDYMASIKDFLMTEKLTIDEMVTRRAITRDFESDEIYFLFPGDFERQWGKILEYKRLRSSNEANAGYITNVDFVNFRRIKDQQVQVGPDAKWVFVTGENGSGKTTFLRALAVGICNNFDGGKKILDENEDFKIQLSLSGVDGDIKHTIASSSPASVYETFTKGFAAYGPLRLVTQGSLDTEFIHVNVESILKRKTYGLFHSISILEDISKELSLISRPKEHEMVTQELLESIEFNLSELLPNVARVELIENATGGFDIQYYQNEEDIPLPFKHLSSGTKNFAALFLDLMLKFRVQLARVKDVSNLRGVVLIDEIDLHLHPKMQKEMVRQLSETFPNLQFIVTTHSPIPLLGAPENSIFIKVSTGKKGGIVAEKIDIKIKNLLPNTILTSPIFDFDEIASVNHQADERLETEDSYSETIFYRILEAKIKENSQKSDSKR